MNKFKINNKTIVAKYPKDAAKLFIKKYPKFDKEFSVYNLSTKKVYGFYHRNNLTQSGGYTDISNSDGNLNQLNRNLANKKRYYNIITIPLNSNYNKYKTFSNKLSINNSLKTIKEDFLKIMIYKLQFINEEDDIYNYIRLIGKYYETYYPTIMK